MSRIRSLLPLDQRAKGPRFQCSGPMVRSTTAGRGPPCGSPAAKTEAMAAGGRGKPTAIATDQLA